MRGIYLQECTLSLLSMFCFVCVCLDNNLDLNSPKKDILVYQGLYNPLVCVCVGVRFLPRGSSQQHLPVVTAAVNEDVPGSAVRPRAAETLRRVAFLQRALVLLHGQAVVGQTQLLVGCLWV